jgi:hypothetical protein
VCDIDRWSALERAGCVVQVNQLATADGFDPDFDHRQAASTSSEPTFLRAEVSRLVRGDGAIGIVAAALLGSLDARLFNDQYIVKPPHRHGRALDSSCFQWHYDSQWCDGDCKANYRQYLSAWVALDDVSEENGTLRMLPYAPGGDGGRRDRLHFSATSSCIAAVRILPTSKGARGCPSLATDQCLEKMARPSV